MGQLYTIKIVGVKDGQPTVMLEADGKNFHESVQDEIADFESSKALKLKSIFDKVVDSISVPVLDDNNKIISKKQLAEYYVYDEVSFFKCLDSLNTKLQECENTRKQYFNALIAAVKSQENEANNAISNTQSDIFYLTKVISDLKYYSNIFHFTSEYMFYGQGKNLILNQSFDDYFFIFQEA